MKDHDCQTKRTVRKRRRSTLYDPILLQFTILAGLLISPCNCRGGSTIPSLDKEKQKREHSHLKGDKHDDVEIPRGVTTKSRKENQRASPPASLPAAAALPSVKPPVVATFNSSASKDELDFMSWCQKVMGIYTILEIQTFEYYDYMKAMPVEDWDDDLADDRVSVEQLPKIPVRGLAASRDIEIGETVIRIPLPALLSVATTIDHDPVLSNVIGPKGRQKYGWDEETDDEAAYMTEIPLLAVALLHHRRLGSKSPLYPYIRILEQTSVENMPFMWSKKKLKTEVSEGVRTVARGIRKDIQDMYSMVVEVLIRDHPELFAPASGERNDEWMFSYEKFQWAFTMVNSRHWQLPIAALRAQKVADPSSSVGGAAQNPPAATPTDEWVRDHPNFDDDEKRSKLDSSQRIVAHSFLAPMADLLNFGPPCTRGKYDNETNTFEIVASCNFQKGQEVTFWYSDECDHVIAGVYGFTHPMVPGCPTAEEYRRRSEEWAKRAESLEERLAEAYDELDRLDNDLLRAQEILDGCDCCRYDREAARKKPLREPSTLLRRDSSMRGYSRPFSDREDIERHGVRRKWSTARNSRKSEF